MKVIVVREVEIIARESDRNHVNEHKLLYVKLEKFVSGKDTRFPRKSDSGGVLTLA